MTNTLAGEIYRGWASVYESFEAAASLDTWKQGVVRELRRLGCADARILDIGAGTGIGRRALLDAFPGCTVVSLDQSADMLERGRIPPDLAVVADMSSFRIDEAGFDFVVSGFDALNYLAKEDLGNCFACVASALRVGGRLVFDYSTRKLLKYDWGHLDCVREADGMQLACSHRYEPLLDRTRVDLALTRSGELLWRETHHHYSVDPYDLHELAAASNLHVLYGRDIDREQFSPASGTHVWVLERRDA